MTAKWLTLRNLRRNQDLLKAINTLSLHLQLRLEGQVNDVRAETLATAQARLTEFLTNLEAGLQEAEASETGLIYGADPRFQAFVETYQTTRQAGGLTPLAIDLATIQHDLKTTDPIDPARLLGYLTVLRSLVEAQINQDVIQAL